MAPSSRGVAWLRDGSTTLCQELRDAAGRSGAVQALLSHLGDRGDFPCSVWWLQTHCWFFSTLCVFQATYRQRRGLPPRRVCQGLPPFLSDVEDASRALPSGVREAHTRAGMHFIMALPVF